MAVDRGGHMCSAELGAGVDGNWGFDKVNMQVGVYKGENYNKVPGDKGKDIMGRASVRLISTNEGGRDGGLCPPPGGVTGQRVALPTRTGRRTRPFSTTTPPSTSAIPHGSCTPSLKSGPPPIFTAPRRSQHASSHMAA